MSSGKNAYPPLIEGRRYKFYIRNQKKWYVGQLETTLESVDGTRASFVFGDGKKKWVKFTHCYESNEPLSAISPPKDQPVLPRLTYGTPATPQSADPFPFAGAYIANNPAGQAAPVGQRVGYSVPPPGAAGGRHGPGNGPGQYAGAPDAAGRGIPPQGAPYTGQYTGAPGAPGPGFPGQGVPYSGNAAPGQGGPYYGVPPGQAAPYNAAPGFQGNPAYGQGNAAMPPPGFMPPYYGMAGNTAAPGYGSNYYGTPGAGPSNAQGYGDGGYGTYGDGGANAPGGSSSSSGQN